MSFRYGRSIRNPVGGAFPFVIMPLSQVPSPPVILNGGAVNASAPIAFPLSLLGKVFWLSKSYDWTFNIAYNANYSDTYSTNSDTGTVVGTGTVSSQGVNLVYFPTPGVADPVSHRLTLELEYGFPVASSISPPQSGVIVETPKIGPVITTPYSVVAEAFLNLLANIGTPPPTGPSTYLSYSLIAKDTSNKYYFVLGFSFSIVLAYSVALTPDNTPISPYIIEPSGITFTIIVDSYSITVPLYLRRLPYNSSGVSSIVMTGSITFNFNQFLTP